jgi:hypothetical protein
LKVNTINPSGIDIYFEIWYFMKSERREAKQNKKRIKRIRKSNRKMLHLHEMKISGQAHRDQKNEREIYEQFRATTKKSGE